MPRLNKKAELFSHLTEVGVMREASGVHGDTTLSIAAAAAATVLEVPATGDFTAGDYVMIDAAESMEIAQVDIQSPTQLKARNGIYRAHPVGTPVVEVVRTILGDLTDEGVQLALAEGDFNAILSATQREPVGYIAGHIAQMAEFGILNLSPENLCAALGIPESAISGSGSAAEPTKLDLMPDAFASEADAAWYFRGVRKDGMNIEVQLWGVEVDPTALSAALQFARGNPVTTPFRLRPTAGVRWLQYT